MKIFATAFALIFMGVCFGIYLALCVTYKKFKNLKQLIAKEGTMKFYLMGDYYIIQPVLKEEKEGEE